MKITIFLIVFCVSYLHAAEYTCPPLASHPTPSNINNLHPNDINVVMAIGDSITAAFGLMGVEGGLDEFRGQSWSIGGDKGAMTVANFLKHFNPKIQGFSVGQHVVELCYDILCPSPHYPNLDHLNGAQSGAYAENLPAQVNYILQQIQNNPNIDMKNDWKVLTILIGANNLCLSCFSDMNVVDAANVFEKYLTQTIDMIQTNFPRTFINIVEIFNVSQVYELAMNYTYCRDIHRTLALECLCAYDPIDGPANRLLMDEMAQAYNQKIRNIVASMPKSDDFAVVLQPCFSEGKIPAINWLSDLDCFHPSLIGHQGMATALWNNMLNPSASKQDYIDANDVPLCPTNSTLLYTY